ncbi:hypothetical protein XELAEV_18002526mg [Xenopus laevis]|nr:hypothetical protein XELAEV_18002526mg [Xenopus laevis]
MVNKINIIIIIISGPGANTAASTTDVGFPLKIINRFYHFIRIATADWPVSALISTHWHLVLPITGLITWD